MNEIKINTKGENIIKEYKNDKGNKNSSAQGKKKKKFPQTHIHTHVHSPPTSTNKSTPKSEKKKTKKLQN